MLKVLDITTNIGCSVLCQYCPQDQSITNYLKNSKLTNLSYETFKTCIDKIPKNIDIIFSGFSEAFLNKDAIKMLEYVNNNNFERIFLYTTCVGLKISDIDILKIIPFKGVVVHLPENNNLMKVNVNSDFLDLMNKLFSSKILNIQYIYK